MHAEAGVAVAGYGVAGPASRALVQVGVLAVSLAIGHAIREQRLSAALLVQQTQQRAVETMTQERLRIARELHDVVAHSMSLITVQAGVAAYAGAPDDPARQVLASIESNSREALKEMRLLLGVLRDADATQEADLAPARGLRDLDDLAERARNAGLEVALTISGTPHGLNAAAELAAYRIVQECVTNVIKHAHAKSVSITVMHRPDALCIDVADDGVGAVGRSTTGQGLVGMREGVRMFSGRLDVSSMPHRGFRVSASIPLEGGAL